MNSEDLALIDYCLTCPADKRHIMQYLSSKATEKAGTYLASRTLLMSKNFVEIIDFIIGNCECPTCLNDIFNAKSYRTE